MYHTHLGSKSFAIQTQLNMLDFNGKNKPRVQIKTVISISAIYIIFLHGSHIDHKCGIVVNMGIFVLIVSYIRHTMVTLQRLSHP